MIETPKWPYRLSKEVAELTVATRTEAGEAFQGNDWFSLGFQAEIAGKSVDVAPLVAAFLEQTREEWEEVPDIDTLAQYLADQPVYLDRGKLGYVALDLGPLAPLLHLFLTHYAELGALHPSDASVARLVEEALVGSAIRFADNAGILPLARSLQALAEAGRFEPPKGLNAQLRDYQAYGAAWMGSLLEAGFGGVLADDMGLGKTVQTLALLQARREAGAPARRLLIVPTSLLHGWQTQAAQFTPDLRLVVLHGPDRAALRDAAPRRPIWCVTTYPLLARDRDWLAAQDWPLVILDEAQTLKNPASQMARTLRDIPAKGRLALTGTPLENSLQDLWTLIDWVNARLAGRPQAVSDACSARRSRSMARPPRRLRLNRRLRPFILRRTQGRGRRRTAAQDRDPRAGRAAETRSSALRDACAAPWTPACARRCWRAAGSPARGSRCWTRCSSCARSAATRALVEAEAARSVTDSAKRARLCEMLAELVAEGRRVLVFSQFVEMLRLIEADLAAAGIPPPVAHRPDEEPAPRCSTPSRRATRRCFC